MKVNIASQNTGVMSTPKAGGIDPLTNRNKGSVGHATIFHGSLFKSVSGYHDATTRHSYQPILFIVLVCIFSIKTTNSRICEIVQRKRRRCNNNKENYKRLTMAKDKKFKKGPRMRAVGWTHPSVSAKSKPVVD